jgi:hypothetical protein
MPDVRAVALLAALVVGCATTPEEIARIRAENELLKEEIAIIRKNCSYYRELEIEAEPEGSDAP